MHKPGKGFTSNDTQSDIQSTLSKARATQNFVGFAKQSVNRKAFLVRTIFSPTKIFNNCHQKLFREHKQPRSRCEQGCKNEKLVITVTKNYFVNMTNIVPDTNKAAKTKNWWLQNFQIFCKRQTLFFVVVRTGSQTDTFGKSTIFSSFAGVQVFVKRGLTVYRLLITMIRIGNYFLTLFHGGGGGGELPIMAFIKNWIIG